LHCKEGLNIPGLQTAVQGYYLNELALSTLQAYTGQTCYMKFCQQLNTPPLPTTETTLLLFMAHLTKDYLAYTTIKLDLSAILQLT